MEASSPGIAGVDLRRASVNASTVSRRALLCPCETKSSEQIGHGLKEGGRLHKRDREDCGVRTQVRERRTAKERKSETYNE